MYVWCVWCVGSWGGLDAQKATETCQICLQTCKRTIEAAELQRLHKTPWQMISSSNPLDSIGWGDCITTLSLHSYKQLKLIRNSGELTLADMLTMS